MGFLKEAFYIILYRPLSNALILLYQYLPGHDFGIAIIALTLAIRILLYPLNAKGIKSQRALSQLQPKIKEVQEKFKHNKEQQTRAVLELYKKEGVNPFFGLLPLLVQLPILIALYRLFWKGLEEWQGKIDTTFLGVIDLAKPSLILAVLTGIVQFIQTKMLVPSKTNGAKPGDFSNMMQKQMLYFFPIFTVFILWKLPAAIGLYWITTTLFTILQQYIILKKEKHAEPRTN